MNGAQFFSLSCRASGALTGEGEGEREGEGEGEGEGGFSSGGTMMGMPTSAPVCTSSVGTSQPDFFLAGFSGDRLLERSRRSLERERRRSRLRLRSFFLSYVPLS